MSGKFSMDDYVDVAERIQTFKTNYPDGSLQTIDWSVTEIANQRFIVYRAAAYRNPDDPRPGHGTAWEPFPGQTQFTRNSELMNAETAAWGRAIVALGLPSSRKLASKQEVRNRQEEQQKPSPPPARAPKTQSLPSPPFKPAKADPGTIEAIRSAAHGLGWDAEEMKLNLTAVGVQDVSDVKEAVDGLTPGQAEEMWSRIETAVQESRAA